MMRVLFLTNFASPYRVHFFDELGKTMDVTVLYSEGISENTHRDAKWFEEAQGNFRAVQLKKTVSRGGENLCMDVLPWLRRDFDHIIVCGYSSPTAMLAMAYLRMRNIPFWMEVDGGLIREESGLKYRFKKLLVGFANAWLSSGENTTRYLVHYGAKPQFIHTYPFTSLWEKDILPGLPTVEEKQQLRRALGMTEEKVILYVGRFTRDKGMDDLLEVAPELPVSVGVYFIGGQPEQVHLDFCREKSLKNVHFVGFQRREELAAFYRAADCMVLPTKSDVWGLVINEAMAYGLPVITTDRCVAGLELVKDGVNGFLVPVEDKEALAEKLNRMLSMDMRSMGEAALETIRPYTLENMAQAHVRILEGGM